MRFVMFNENWERVKSDGSCEDCDFLVAGYDWVEDETVEICSIPDDFPDCEHKIIFVRK